MLSFSLRALRWASQQSWESTRRPRKHVSCFGGMFVEGPIVTPGVHGSFCLVKWSSSLLLGVKTIPRAEAHSSQVSQALSSCLQLIAADRPSASRLVSSAKPITLILECFSLNKV